MPQYTNRHSLPGPLFRALTSDGYTPGSKKSNISVTSLIGPPLINQLKKRHKDEITEDAADRVWSLLGQSIHTVLERAEDENSIVEKRLYMDISGWTLTGQTDLFEGATRDDGEEFNSISDFKVTSVFSFLLGLKEEWTQQINLNAMLWRNAGHDVHKGQICAILRDWSGTKASIDPNYPQCAVHIVDIPMWDQSACIRFAKERIAIHQKAEKEKDTDKITPCTPEERWYRGGTFAVMKVGNKKATKLAPTKEEALKIMATIQSEKPKDKFEVVERPGENIKCMRFCGVKHWCKFYRENLADSIVNDNED